MNHSHRHNSRVFDPAQAAGAVPASGRGAAVLAAAALMATFAFLPVTAGAASADSLLCGPGSGAGQCAADTQGVAADVETERIYVADRANHRISVFQPDGGFLFAFGWDVIPGGSTGFEKCTTGSGCKAGLPGFGVGQFWRPLRIAVDNDAASPSRHDVYVRDGQENGIRRVQKFDQDGNFVAERTGFLDFAAGLAVGPGGDVYVGDTVTTGSSPNIDYEPQLKRFDDELQPLGECDLEYDNSPVDLAIDSAGDVLARFIDLSSYKFDWEEPTCPKSGPPYDPLDGGSGFGGIAFDMTGNLYAAREVAKAGGAGGGYRTISVYDASANVLRRYGYGFLENPNQGVAPLQTAFGDVVVSDREEGVKYLTEPPAGPLSTPPEADPVGNVRATLSAEIDPSGKAVEYHFEYLTEQAYQDQGESFTGPATKSTPVEELDSGAADYDLHLASAEVGCPDPVAEASEPESDCLEPETEYRFRIVAENSDGEGNLPLEAAFTTLEPLAIEATFASEVGTETARLSARVNPLGIPAAGHFEYVALASFEASGFVGATRVPASEELDFGAGEAGALRSVQLSLAPDTAYRYRIVVENPLIAPRPGPTSGFRTYRPGEVPPCANDAFRTGSGAGLPDCRAYELVSPLDKEGGDIVTSPEEGTLLPATLSQSALSGEKLAYGSYRAFGDAEAAPNTAQYVAARTPTGWRTHYILGPWGQVIGIGSLSELNLLSGDLCQAWIRTISTGALAEDAIPDQVNLYRRSDQLCGEESYEVLNPVEFPHETAGLEFQGASADGERSIFAANDNLTADAPDLEGRGFGLYLREAGGEGLRYLCYLPDGTRPKQPCAAGSKVDTTVSGRTASEWNAISADGERVFWTSNVGAFPGKLYLRERSGAEQSNVNKDGECTQAARACTIAVSQEAEGIEGTSSSRYWWAADDGSRALFTTGEALYSFEVDTKTTTPLAKGVVGLMGADEEAKRIYFASTEVLGGENSEGMTAQAGEPNLYFKEGPGEAKFIATLVQATDVSSKFSAISLEPVARSSRVSPDGLHASFMSSGQLTDYDNADAQSGEPDAEVYRYDAAAEELSCASCNPSGARPAGAFIRRGNQNLWAAALTPAWFKSLYPGRVLADDGSRLYFEAVDSLTPRDSNGAIDVYQWEEPGTGGCSEESPAYSEQNEGCVELISSGQSPGDAEFLDASPSGSDVFFTTARSLVPWDYGLVDVYDARVGGGLPGPAEPEKGCEGETCQSPASPPRPSTPGSLSYRGPGNVGEASGAARCNGSARRAKRLAIRAKRLRRASRRAEAPVARRKRARAARRSANRARRLSRSAKRCRARARGTKR